MQQCPYCNAGQVTAAAVDSNNDGRVSNQFFAAAGLNRSGANEGAFSVATFVCAENLSVRDVALSVMPRISLELPLGGLKSGSRESPIRGTQAKQLGRGAGTKPAIGTGGTLRVSGQSGSWIEDFPILAFRADAGARQNSRDGY